jgi:DNA-binding HxlR family transcriptional regulator
MPSPAPREPIDPVVVNAVLIAVRQAADVLCDRWTLLVLLHAHAGATRFADLRARCGCASRLLTSRLAALEAQELLVRLPYSRRPLRHGYHLTPMGLALFDTFAALLRWELRWHGSAGTADAAGLALDHLACGHTAIRPKLSCSHCGAEVLARDSVLKVNQKELQAMPERATTYRRSTGKAGSDGRAGAGPLPQALGILGDKWTIEVVVAAFVRVNTFGGFQAHTGMATNILADRLARLTAAGVLRLTQDDSDQRRGDYRLSPAGLDLFGLLVCIEAWADHWLHDRTRSPLRTTHSPCGQPLRLRLSCPHCLQTLRREDCRWRPAVAGTERADDDNAADDASPEAGH